MASVPNDAAHRHMRADKAWQLATQIAGPEAKSAALKQYERLSIRAADRERALAMAGIDRKGENPEMSVWGLS
jgi:hypothetical protein